MLNTKFIAMKKVTLILFLLCLIWQPVLLNAQTNNEKFDLSPKIEKGDSWNMVTDARSLIKYSTNPGSKLEKIGFPNRQQANANWKVTCQSADNEVLQLRFTLSAISQYNTFSAEGNDQVYYYNDSDFPVSLSEEHVTQIQDIIGKSFSYIIPMDAKKEIEIADNEFTDKKMNFPVVTFQSKERSYTSVNYSNDSYLLGGPIMIKFLLDTWRQLLPSHEVKIGDSWKASVTEKGENKMQLTLKEVSETKFFLEIMNGDTISDLILDKNSLLPVFNNVQDDFGFCTYNEKQNNISINGNLNKPEFNGQATLKIEYPVGKEKVLVKVVDGKFKLDYNLEAPVLATFKYNGIRSQMFLIPGMDLRIDWDNKKKRFVASGLGEDDFNCVREFLSEYFRFDYDNSPFVEGEISKRTKKYKKDIEVIQAKYDKLSRDCEQFLETDMNFRIANSYLNGIEEIDKEIQFAYMKRKFDKKVVAKNRILLSQFVDSLQLVGNISPISYWYHEFIMDNLEQEQRRFLAERGRRIDKDNFRENIFFASIQYVGYPYYYSVFKILEKEIQKGNLSLIGRELEDFYNLPCNPVFKNSLEQLSKKIAALNPGRSFPFQEIMDIDSSIQKLPKGELCIVDLQESFTMQKPQHKLQLKELSQIIKDDGRINKINYVVIRADFAKGKMVETPSNDTVNFSHIYLPKDDISLLEKSYLIDGRRRILLLDKDLKIINNNLERIQKYSGHHFPKVLDEYFESQNQPKSYKNRIAVILGALTSLLLIVLTTWLAVIITTKQVAKKEAARRKLSELELKAIRSQMNPHFIFNALGSIQNLINQNNTKNANLYLSRFARLMRMVLANSNKKLVSLSDELELLKNYLELEQLRVDFQFEISVNENIDPETEEIPGMLVQPFVENAVIHGITPKGKGNISVGFSKTQDTLVCKIIDDGVGINTKGEGNGNGVAMKLAEKRLNLLNSQLQTKLRLTVENRMDTEQTEGTTITLLIPVG
jgi:two-component sensor histidine kinase